MVTTECYSAFRRGTTRAQGHAFAVNQPSCSPFSRASAPHILSDRPLTAYNSRSWVPLNIEIYAGVYTGAQFWPVPAVALRQLLIAHLGSVRGLLDRDWALCGVVPGGSGPLLCITRSSGCYYSGFWIHYSRLLEALDAIFTRFDGSI